MADQEGDEDIERGVQEIGGKLVRIETALQAKEDEAKAQTLHYASEIDRHSKENDRLREENERLKAEREASATRRERLLTALRLMNERTEAIMRRLGLPLAVIVGLIAVGVLAYFYNPYKGGVDVASRPAPVTTPGGGDPVPGFRIGSAA